MKFESVMRFFVLHFRPKNFPQAAQNVPERFPPFTIYSGQLIYAVSAEHYALDSASRWLPF